MPAPFIGPACFAPVFQFIEQHQPKILLIDGMSGAGKTSLAQLLEKQYHTCTIHMDDYFLPAHLITEERRREPGGNFHYERFQQEVVQPLYTRRPLFLRRFDCQRQQLLPPRHVPQRALTVIEGSYAAHPWYRPKDACTCYLWLSPATQRQRLLQRETPASYQRFIDCWIPLENFYAASFHLQTQVDLCINTTHL